MRGALDTDDSTGRSAIVRGALDTDDSTRGGAIDGEGRAVTCIRVTQAPNLHAPLYWLLGHILLPAEAPVEEYRRFINGHILVGNVTGIEFPLATKRLLQMNVIFLTLASRSPHPHFQRRYHCYCYNNNLIIFYLPIAQIIIRV